MFLLTWPRHLRHGHSGTEQRVAHCRVGTLWPLKIKRTTAKTQWKQRENLPNLTCSTRFRVSRVHSQSSRVVNTVYVLEGEEFHSFRYFVSTISTSLLSWSKKLSTGPFSSQGDDPFRSQRHRNWSLQSSLDQVTSIKTTYVLMKLTETVAIVWHHHCLKTSIDLIVSWYKMVEWPYALYHGIGMRHYICRVPYVLCSK